MKINYNVSAAIANKNLLGIENNLSKSMERLSSGFKINHAKDNPAGMAISNKMKAQIDALDRASQNASDGISVIEIADGALNEVTNILQRMRELSVQAANDATMSVEDKQAIQAEIDSLKEEVDRISRDTEYNTQSLFDGSFDTRVYTEHAERVQVSDQTAAGTYKIEITKAATQASGVRATATYNDDTGAVGVSGTMTINGAKVDVEETDTFAQVYEKIRDAAELGGVSVVRSDQGDIEFKSNAYGTEGQIAITFDSEELSQKLDVWAPGYNVIQDSETNAWVLGKLDNGTITYPRGENMEISPDMEGFSSSATVALDGNRVTITDLGGVSLSFLAEEGYTGDIEFEVTDIGTMTLHIGANKDQNMVMRIPEISCEMLYIDDLNVVMTGGAGSAISRLDEAIAQVSDARSRLGAYQNRLEYSTSSLDSFEENMTSALSRLTDADMAEEMTEYTHQNILNQAAISVLTQANELPQQVLQILQ